MQFSLAQQKSEILFFTVLCFLPVLHVWHFYAWTCARTSSLIDMENFLARFPLFSLRNDDIVLLERIGNGNFGEVYKGIMNTTGQDVAVKTCKINLPEDQKKKFLQEGSILKQYNQ